VRIPRGKGRKGRRKREGKAKVGNGKGGEGSPRIPKFGVLPGSVATQYGKVMKFVNSSLEY